MAVREIVAWVMTVVFGLVGGYCLSEISRAGFSTAPNEAVISAASVTVTIVVALEIALWIFFPRQSAAPPDERERLIIARAGHWAGLALLVGVLPALGHYAVHGDGNIMFHVIVLSMLASGVVEYGAQIILFRR